MKPVFESEMSPKQLVQAIASGEATPEEIFQLIVELDDMLADWDWTERLAKHFCTLIASGDVAEMYEVKYINLKELQK